jgi:hypothetical protein
LDGDVENNPHIDLCSSCDRKYREALGGYDDECNS